VTLLVANERYVHIFAFTSQYKDVGPGKRYNKIGTAVNAVCFTFASFAINSFCKYCSVPFWKASNKCVGHFGFSPTLMSKESKLTHVHK